MSTEQKREVGGSRVRPDRDGAARVGIDGRSRADHAARSTTGARRRFGVPPGVGRTGEQRVVCHAATPGRPGSSASAVNHTAVPPAACSPTTSAPMPTTSPGATRRDRRRPPASHPTRRGAPLPRPRSRRRQRTHGCGWRAVARCRRGRGAASPSPPAGRRAEAHAHRPATHRAGSVFSERRSSSLARKERLEPKIVPDDRKIGRGGGAQSVHTHADGYPDC